MHFTWKTSSFLFNCKFSEGKVQNYSYSFSLVENTYKAGDAQAAFYVIDIWNVSHWNEIANISCFY